MIVKKKTVDPDLLFAIAQAAVLAGWLILLRIYPLEANLKAIRPYRLVDFFLMQPGLFVPTLAVFAWIALAFLAGLWVLRARAVRLAPQITLATFLLAALILLLVFPIESADVFANLWYQRIFTTYGLNPFINIVREFMRLDPWQGVAPDLTYLSGLPYGPAWFYLLLLPAFIFRSSLLGTMISLRCLTALFFLLTLLPVYQLAKELSSLANSPRAFWTGAYLFLLNPIFLLDFVNGGHNDPVAIFFWVSGLLFLYQKKLFWFSLAFTLATLTKYVTLIVLPFVLIYWWQQGGGFMKSLLIWGKFFLVLVVVTLLLFEPIWQGPRTLLALFRQINLWGFAPITFLQYIFLKLGMAKSGALAKAVGLGIFVIAYLLLLLESLGKNLSFAKMSSFSLLAVFAYFYLVSGVLFHWYMLWLVPFVFFASNTKEVWGLGLTITLLAFLVVPVSFYLLSLAAPNKGKMFEIQVWSVFVTYLLPLFGLFILRLKRGFAYA